MKLRVAGGRAYYYPDVMLSCEPATPDEVYKDPPCLVAEVLSPSTAARYAQASGCTRSTNTPTWLSRSGTRTGQEIAGDRPGNASLRRATKPGPATAAYRRGISLRQFYSLIFRQHSSVAQGLGDIFRFEIRIGLQNRSLRFSRSEKPQEARNRKAQSSGLELADQLGVYAYDACVIAYFVCLQPADELGRRLDRMLAAKFKQVAISADQYVRPR